jgi:hypothetical protein
LRGSHLVVRRLAARAHQPLEIDVAIGLADDAERHRPRFEAIDRDRVLGEIDRDAARSHLGTRQSASRSPRTANSMSATLAPPVPA